LGRKGRQKRRGCFFFFVKLKRLRTNESAHSDNTEKVKVKKCLGTKKIWTNGGRKPRLVQMKTMGETWFQNGRGGRQHKEKSGEKHTLEKKEAWESAKAGGEEKTARVGYSKE